MKLDLVIIEKSKAISVLQDISIRRTKIIFGGLLIYLKKEIRFLKFKNETYLEACKKKHYRKPSNQFYKKLMQKIGNKSM